MNIKQQEKKNFNDADLQRGYQDLGKDHDKIGDQHMSPTQHFKSHSSLAPHSRFRPSDSGRAYAHVLML
eukprot:479906-Alexandrium_andersonii.AAC.1